MKGLVVLFNPRLHYSSLVQSFSVLFRYRQLIREMTKAEISTRYAGQTLGVLWAFLQPAVQVGVYIFVFAFVFKTKYGGTTELPLDYTAFLLSGLIPWLAMQESLGKSPTVILNNANLVRQMVFPIEILPIKDVLASSLTLFFSLYLMIIYVLVTNNGELMMSYLLLPILIFLQILGSIGLCYILSSIGAYFRDLQSFVEAFLRIGLFIAPIFYLPTMIPPALNMVFKCNPFSYMIWCYHDVLYYGRIEHPEAWWVFSALSIGGFYIGYKIFNKLKLGLGEVL